MDGLYVHLSAERGSDWLPEDRCKVKFRTVVIIVDKRGNKTTCMNNFKSETILEPNKTFVIRLQTVLSLYLPTTVLKLVEPVPVHVNLLCWDINILCSRGGKKVM